MLPSVGSRDCIQDVALLTFVDVTEQCLLAREVVIDRTFGYRRGRGDVFERRGLIPVVNKQLASGSQEASDRRL
jgi:hypothetical protein